VTAAKRTSAPQHPPRSRAIDPSAFTPQFRSRHGALFCEGVSLESLAQRVSTPAYVYSRRSIEDSYRGFRRAFRAVPHTICYAVKANSNLEILRILARLGSSFDIVSGGELYLLRKIGVPGKKIVFSGVGKMREEIREAFQAGILLFNVESPAELEILSEEAARLRIVAPAALRVNPDVEAGGHRHIRTGHHRHKFGIDLADAAQLYINWRNVPSIRWRGISMHLGSQILGATSYHRAAQRIARFVGRLRVAGIHLDFADFGGGYGVQYSTERPPALAQYARALTPVARSLNCRLLIEPGRRIVGPSSVLLTRVIYTKANRGKTFVVVDAGMNDLIRPVLYDAIHPVSPVRAPAPEAAVRRVDIVGPVCETGDCFLRDWPLPNPHPGDLLAIWGTGAYGFVMASQYNARPRPAEVLVEGRKFRVIRRRESRADLTRGE
jgi:diaminopimelate decarboxylase